jgi:UDP-glucose 4-epimerase
MKNFLVVGGAGYIGSVVVNNLIDLGYKVIVIDNLSTGHKFLVNKKAIFFF